MLLSVLIILAAGCGEIIRAYEGPARSLSRISVLKGFYDKETGDQAVFMGYAPRLSKREAGKRPGNSLKWLSNFSGRPSEVHMLPGTYLVSVVCNLGELHGGGTLSLALKPGMTYRIQCRLTSSNELRPYVEEAYATEIRAATFDGVKATE